MSEKVKKVHNEYRIIGRFARDEKPHVVDYSWRYSLEDVERRIKEIVEQEKRAKKAKEYKIKAGSFGISMEYVEGYELLDLQIQTREVTSWHNI